MSKVTTPLHVETGIRHIAGPSPGGYILSATWKTLFLHPFPEPIGSQGTLFAQNYHGKAQNATGGRTFAKQAHIDSLLGQVVTKWAEVVRGEAFSCSLGFMRRSRR